MDEIIPGLWIGNLASALNVEMLKVFRIFSILSAMRGRITVNETFIRHQIQLDDSEDEDILIHLLPSIHFIQAELDKGRGVLVHCQGGISRSATIVAAYLMYTRNIDPDAALKLIRKARPNVDPNEGFLQQLQIFHRAQFKISRHDKATRQFYMERTAGEVINGDGSLLETEMFAKYPHSPTDSSPATPGGPRRRIRCKMCRQALATREHMLDHGQLGPATPVGVTPAASRRSSTSASLSRPSSGNLHSPSGSLLEPMAHHPSLLSYEGTPESVSLLPLDREQISEEVELTPKPPFSSSRAVADSSTSSSSNPQPSITDLRTMSHSFPEDSLSMSALEIEDDGDNEVISNEKSGSPSKLLPGSVDPLSTLSIEAAKLVGRRLSDAVISTPLDNTNPFDASPSETMTNTTGASEPVEHPTTHLTSSSDLTGQLLANPKLTGLRSPPSIVSASSRASMSSSILVNPKCSGYFVEPMKWMEPFLASGQLVGKIICPNKKCSAKLGNYDWAGVCCGCKEWVTPGFCIHRSKVDEIV